MKDQSTNSERRDFLKTAGGAAIAAGFPGIISAQTVTNAIKVGLVGCGGRGSGAASQALAADDYTELTAVADIDQAQIDHACNRSKRIAKIAARVKVETASQYLGLDAFQKVIDSKVDVVLLATPPGFRPQHLAACIAANKHVFCEKPISTDAPGVRSVLADRRAGEAEESVAGGRLLLALQQHDPGHVPAGGERRHRKPGRLLRDLLHQPGEADAARQHASRRHERRRVADSQLVQLRLALRRQSGGAGGPQRRQDRLGHARRSLR